MNPSDFELSQIPPDDDYALSNAYWYVTLSNGQTIYQDDDNPSKRQKSSWIALKRYLNVINERVVRVVLKFRSNERHFEIQDNIEWLYLSKGAGKEWTAEDVDKFFIVGWQISPTQIIKHWYKLPALAEFEIYAEALSKAIETPEFLHLMPSKSVI